MKQSFALALACFASLLQSHAIPVQVNQHGIHDGVLRDGPHVQRSVGCVGDDCYCQSIYDLTLIIDESGSIGEKHWKNSVFPFTKNIVNSLDVAADKIHVGVMLFARENRDYIKFSHPESLDKDKLLKKVDLLENDYRHGPATGIINALNYAHKEYTLDPKSRLAVPKVTILFTDGDDSYVKNDKLNQSSKIYQQANTKLLVLGVGVANLDKLRLIGGCDISGKNCPHVLKTTWDLLEKISELIVGKICDTNIELPNLGGSGSIDSLPPATCEGDDCYCESIYDLTLIIDESASIGKTNWKNSVFPFTKNIVNSLDVAADKIHVGVILFARENRDYIRFSHPESLNKEKLMKKINLLENDYRQGTATGIIYALNYAHKEYTLDPKSRLAVPKVTILFTDGNDSYVNNDKLNQSSIIYQQANTKLLVLGVGKAQLDKLRLIGGCDISGNDCPHVLKTTWELLEKISELIVGKICDTNIEVPDLGGSGSITGGNTGPETGGNTGSETGGNTGSINGGNNGSENAGNNGSENAGDSENNGNGFSTVGKISLGAGIIGLVLLGAGGAAYGFNALRGGAKTDSSNMEFENVENNVGAEEAVNEDFEVVDANDPMWN